MLGLDCQANSAEPDAAVVRSSPVSARSWAPDS